MTAHVCPNRKGSPRVDEVVCLFHIEQKDQICFKRNDQRKYICEIVRREREKNAR